MAASECHSAGCVKALSPLVAAALLIVGCGAIAPASNRRVEYPGAPRAAGHEWRGGLSIADPYRWLEGNGEDVREWSLKENELARRLLLDLPQRRPILGRLREVLGVERRTVPVRRGDRLFYVKRSADDGVPTLCWRDGEVGTEHMLLDPRRIARGEVASLGDWMPSWDGKRVALGLHENNSDEARLLVTDVDTGDVTETISDAGFAPVAWDPKGGRFFYAHVPDVGRSADGRMAHEDLRVHVVGTDPSSDAVVRGANGDPGSYSSVYTFVDCPWLVLSIAHGWSRNDLYVADLTANSIGWVPLFDGGKEHHEVIGIDGNRLFVRTDEGAPTYRIETVDLRDSARRWQRLIEARSGAVLLGGALVAHRLATEYLIDGKSELEIHDESGTLLRRVALPSVASVSPVSGGTDHERMYYSVESFTHPTEIVSEDVEGGQRSTWFAVKAPDTSGYSLEQIFATSRDGTRIPAFVVTSTHAQEPSPTMLEGYGGFGIAMMPRFALSLFPWLERGGTWVLAQVRGGGEYGEDWHRGGMRHSKARAFEDFIAVAEELVRRGLTRPDELAIRGTSNGGLLVAATLTQVPHLFAAAICDRPLTDMLRYPLFGSGRQWIDEFGSPDDPSDRGVLASYSPYHHVVRGTRYPATLVITGDNDDRVNAMHARKFTAALQWATTGGPVLLRVEDHAGHAGAALREDVEEEIADEYAFALSAMNRARQPAPSAASSSSEMSKSE